MIRGVERDVAGGVGDLHDGRALTVLGEGENPEAAGDDGDGLGGGANAVAGYGDGASAGGGARWEEGDDLILSDEEEEGVGRRACDGDLDG
jgi:hypothetical protein